MKYGSKVRVTSGFYEEMEGIVINKFLWFYQIRYGYWQKQNGEESNSKREFAKTFLISKSSLELIK